ncbi:hypothetical protein GQ54DRAFT_321760 [Martensiomyces pterosporus]|nr:hypothetical protein GQ54DRAFT_321760 [Martensiomyces pterosporus]
MACLTKNHKLAVINHLHNGLSTRETARKVGVSHSTVNKVATRLLGDHVVKKGGRPSEIEPAHNNLLLAIDYFWSSLYGRASL